MNTLPHSQYRTEPELNQVQKSDIWWSKKIPQVYIDPTLNRKKIRPNKFGLDITGSRVDYYPIFDSPNQNFEGRRYLFISCMYLILSFLTGTKLGGLRGLCLHPLKHDFKTIKFSAVICSSFISSTLTVSKLSMTLQKSVWRVKLNPHHFLCYFEPCDMTEIGQYSKNICWLSYYTKLKQDIN